MLELEAGNLDTARVGRMGELVVELELVARGWFVGNFNATRNNSTGWDLFAAKAGHSVKIRVKAKKPGVDAFRWGAKPSGEVLLGLRSDDPTDFVAAVDFKAAGDYDVYLMRSAELEATLADNHRRYLAGAKFDGSARKDSPQRNLIVFRRGIRTPFQG